MLVAFAGHQSFSFSCLPAARVVCAFVKYLPRIKSTTTTPVSTAAGSGVTTTTTVVVVVVVVGHYHHHLRTTIVFHRVSSATLVPTSELEITGRVARVEHGASCRASTLKTSAFPRERSTFRVQRRTSPLKSTPPNCSTLPLCVEFILRSILSTLYLNKAL